jgi:hypothetical protein
MTEVLIPRLSEGTRASKDLRAAAQRVPSLGVHVRRERRPSSKRAPLKLALEDDRVRLAYVRQRTDVGLGG